MDWKRGSIIGRGSTASVSLATSTSSGDLFAVKSANLSNSAPLQKEEFFLSRLSSPYVVKYIGHEITQENNNSEQIYNIRLEYAPGGTLHDAIAATNGGRLDESAIRSYTRSITQGLDYLHNNGLAHCDIKSQNILITKDGAKIADFGCARFVDGETIFSGTPVFMSPEVARGEEQGFPADVWALGCTIIEMATGKIPWGERNCDPVSALFKIGFSGETPEIPACLSEKGRDFVSKCLRRDPRERSTAKELLDNPFVDDVKEVISMSFSPSCVLDQDFWDSMDGLESSNHDLEVEDLSNSNSPSERIRSLIGSSSSSSSWGDEGWISVRSGEVEEDEDVLFLLVDSVSVVSDSNVDEQEIESSSGFDQDLLMDFSENENRISEINFNINDFVLDDYLNFETADNNNNNNNKILFASISFLLLLFIHWLYQVNYCFLLLFSGLKFLCCC